MLTYLGIGLVFIFILECIFNSHPQTSNVFNWSDRLLYLLLWPLALLVILISIIRKL